MSEQERRAYLLSMLARYGRAGRALKGVMLDEYCANAGVGRKHAIACLRQMRRVTEGCSGVVKPGAVPTDLACATRTGRPVHYATDASLVVAIHAIWEAPSDPAASAWWRYYRPGSRTTNSKSASACHARPSARSTPSQRPPWIGCWPPRARRIDNDCMVSRAPHQHAASCWCAPITMSLIVPEALRPTPWPTAEQASRGTSSGC